MIYQGLKFIFKYAIHQYFSEIQVLHKERIPLDKPCMILPNHRSAFMDPIVIATLLKPEMHFLARGESFTKSYMIQIYKRLNMIPIYRKAYSPDEVHKNDDVFRHCYELLERKGFLMIYPEGLCQTHFLLSPLKTGAARIALGAEQKNDYNLDLQMVPIGINYTNPHRFRGSVVLDVGEPISVADYKAQFEADSERTVHELTARLEEDLTNLIITIKDDQDTKLIRQTETLFGHQIQKAENTAESWYETRKVIAGGINYFRNTNPVELNKFDERVTHYLQLADLHVHKLPEMPDILDTLKITNRTLKFTILLLLLPLFALGFLTHGLAYLLTRKIALTIVKRTDFTGSVVLALGILVFTIFVAIESYFLFAWTQSFFLTILFVLIWPSLGLFTYSYFATAYQFLRLFKIKREMKNLNHLNAFLVKEKEAILNILTRAYEDYKTNSKHNA